MTDAQMDEMRSMGKEFIEVLRWVLEVQQSVYLALRTSRAT